MAVGRLQMTDAVYRLQKQCIKMMYKMKRSKGKCLGSVFVI